MNCGANMKCEDHFISLLITLAIHNTHRELILDVHFKLVSTITFAIILYDYIHVTFR